VRTHHARSSCRECRLHTRSDHPCFGTCLPRKQCTFSRGRWSRRYQEHSAQQHLSRWRMQYQQDKQCTGSHSSVPPHQNTSPPDREALLMHQRRSSGQELRKPRKPSHLPRPDRCLGYTVGRWPFHSPVQSCPDGSFRTRSRSTCPARGGLCQEGTQCTTCCLRRRTRC